jgi:hypothetical protein
MASGCAKRFRVNGMLTCAGLPLAIPLPFWPLAIAAACRN